MHGVALSGLAHGDRIEPGRLDQDIVRVVRDHCVEATHDSGKSDRLLRIGDDQIFWRQLAVNSVECFQRFPSAGAPNDDLSSLQKIEIERVSGMSHFPQGIVRGIRRIVDWALIN